MHPPRSLPGRHAIQLPVIRLACRRHFSPNRDFSPNFQYENFLNFVGSMPKKSRNEPRKWWFDPAQPDKTNTKRWTIGKTWEETLAIFEEITTWRGEDNLPDWAKVLELTTRKDWDEQVKSWLLSGLPETIYEFTHPPPGECQGTEVHTATVVLLHWPHWCPISAWYCYSFKENNF